MLKQKKIEFQKHKTITYDKTFSGNKNSALTILAIKHCKAQHEKVYLAMLVTIIMVSLVCKQFLLKHCPWKQTYPSKSTKYNIPPTLLTILYTDSLIILYLVKVELGQP
jgi:hypothetical protein